MPKPLPSNRLATLIVGAAGTLALLFGLTGPGEGQPTPTPRPGQRPEPKPKPDDPPKAEEPTPLPREIARLIALHNEDREAAELPPLEDEPRLRAAALRHARDMAERGAMDHRGGDGTSFVDRVREEGYPMRRGGENVAFGQKTPEAVMDTWRKSPPHKANILGEFTQVGAAVAKSKRGIPYWCVVFASSLDGTKAPTKAEPATKPSDRE